MNLQFQLDFTQKLPPVAQERIADGMRQAESNADIRWKAVIHGCILAVARRQHELTTDDVLAELEQIPGAPSTHNLSAIGPCMKAAARDGIIRPTTRTVRSKVAKKRGNLHLVWVSRYFGGTNGN